jgi:hypothetical protein
MNNNETRYFSVNFYDLFDDRQSEYSLIPRQHDSKSTDEHGFSLTHVAETRHVIFFASDFRSQTCSEMKNENSSINIFSASISCDYQRKARTTSLCFQTVARELRHMHDVAKRSKQL